MKRWTLLIVTALMMTAVAQADVPQRKKKKGKEDTSWKKSFKRDMKDYDTDTRRTASEALDPEKKDQFEEILERVLQDPDYYVRGAGQDAIAKVQSEERLEEALEALKKHKDFRTREGIVVGLGKRGDEELIPKIVEALEDEKIHVRLSAARALGVLQKKECIEPLIQEMEKKDPPYRLFLAIRQSLEQLTGKFLGNAPQDWRNWWEAHKENFEAGEEADEEEIQRAQEAGQKAKDEQKTVAGVRLDFRVRGLGAPLIVLPEFGYKGDYMEEYIAPLQSTARIYFCDLPPLSAYENLKREAGDRIRYPVDQLCEAFKKWVEESGQKRVGILADQKSCWIAMRFASKYPELLAQMILMSPASSDKALVDQREREIAAAQKRKDADLEHHAQFHLFNTQTGESNYTVKDQDEHEKFRRLHFTLWFGGQFDTSIGHIYSRGAIHKDVHGGVQSGGVAFSGFDLTKEKRANTPTLIIWGKRTSAYSPQDCKMMQKFYRNCRLEVFDNTANVPFIEENEKFIKVVRGFIKSSRKGSS